eukprot:TRINITY_DN3441_c0_g1_i1.p1 TRINITY_DN3441_c0_g1~~TRINITY_DN3441_c0_g1_i1.p1  ORF type:complete len:439 (+),score=37.21 TRINITY_DN3441_c0_g1_i1:1508-2824(+)
MGHSSRTLAVDGVRFRAGAGGSALREEGAPSLCGVHLVCHEINDHQASGFVKAALANNQKKLENSMRLAEVTEELVRNTSRSDLDPSASLARVGDMGIKAATVDPSNRAHFEESSRLLKDLSVYAVDASFDAGGVLVGPPAGQDRAASAVDGAGGSGGPEHGAVAAARAAHDAGGLASSGSFASMSAVAGSRLDGPSQTSASSSLTSAHALIGMNNQSMQQAGPDTARLCSLTRAASAPPVPCSAPVLAGAGSGGFGSGAGRSTGSSSVGDASSALDWPSGERKEYGITLEVLKDPELRAVTSSKLAIAAHKESLKETMASKLPELQADSIEGARNDVLLGVMLTCGVLTPARFAEQLCSSRTRRPHSNLLMMLEIWMVKTNAHAAAAAASAATDAGQLGKRRRVSGAPIEYGSEGLLWCHCRRQCGGRHRWRWFFQG